MNLSETAINELRQVLRNQIGDIVDTFSETELQEFGSFVLTTMAESLKIRAQQ